MTATSTRSRTEDGRHIIVDGRTWRATDPSIPESLKAELVAELMAARREIRVQRDHPDLVNKARKRVNNAKHALGERGEPWWEEPTDEGLDTRIQATILSLTNKRGSNATVCPSEIARIVSSPEWRPVLERVRTVASELAASGAVAITASGETLSTLDDHVGPIRIGATSP